MAEDIRRDVLRAAARLLAAEAMAHRVAFITTQAVVAEGRSAAWLNAAARCVILAEKLEPEDG